MRSASLHNKLNGLQIQAYMIYLIDHCRMTVQAVLGLHMLGLNKGKYSLLSFKEERNSRTFADKCAVMATD